MTWKDDKKKKKERQKRKIWNKAKKKNAAIKRKRQRQDKNRCQKRMKTIANEEWTSNNKKFLKKVGERKKERTQHELQIK